MSAPPPSPAAWPAYLRWMFASACGLVALAGAIVFAVDPLGAFGSPRVAGVNARKPYIDHHREETRWHLARQACADVGLFGNSRAEIGFDPLHPAFAAWPRGAFNHAVPGSKSLTSLRQLRWLDAAGCMPKVVVIGVDFFDFLGGDEETVPAPADERPMPARDARYLAETVFSVSGLRDAATTVWAQYRSHATELTERGFNPLRNYVPEVAHSGHDVLFRQRGEDNARRLLGTPPRLRTAAGAESTDMQVLDAMLDLARERGIAVHLVIYPYHARVRLMFAELGLADRYDDWRRDLVARVAQHDAGAMVWDFSGIGEATRERVPSRGDKSAMQWYWEGGHFKKTLGDRVLAQVLQGTADFGQRLDAATIDDWLRRDAVALRALAADDVAMHAEVRDMIRVARRQPGS